MGNEYGAWGFYLERKSYKALLDDGAYVEVIGNIYENPELLKEKAVK